MILSILRCTAFIAVVVLASTVGAQPPFPAPETQPEQLPPPEQPKEQPEPGVKVLDRGPVHEAFAQPGAETRGKDMTAPKAPPAPIPEVPPETKPDGDNVKWIPGYWMWDADREDFIWVSGFWRNAPPGREWSPGKWQQKGDKWIYLPGSWRPTNMNSWRIDLPEPPASVENGPNTPPEDPNALWIPGGWEFRNEQYVWRPGYWARPNGDQMWVPGQYLTTPHGYSYIPGYWDYPLEDRGLLYAPVCFTQPLWQTPGWCYRPRFAIGLGYGGGYGCGGLFSSLYIGRGYNNYYYGCGSSGGSWLGAGFGYSRPLWGPLSSPLWGPLWGVGTFGGYGGYSPWYAGNRGYANPLWNHYCWLNRTNPNYTRNVTNVYVARSLGATNPAPARIVSTQPTAVSGAVNTAVRSAATNLTRPAAPAINTPLVQPATQVAKSIATVNTARAATQPAVSANPVTGGRSTINPNLGGGVTITPNKGTVGQSPPIHAGATNPKPGTVAGSTVTKPNVGTPGGVVTTPGGADRLPGVPGVTVKPVTSTPSNSPPVQVQPVIRGGSLPATPPVVVGGGSTKPASPPVVVGGGAKPALPSAPSLPSLPAAPVVRPSAPSLPSLPAAPAVRPSLPSAPPAIRSAPVNPGGGGRAIGGIGGGAKPAGGGGGGGKPAGGGGGGKGGKR